MEKPITQEEKEKRQKMYYVHRDMKSRCYNEKNKRYNRYGGRGIKVCNNWLNNLDQFIIDMDYPLPDMQLDRIDNDGDYEPLNCRWATRKQQNDNRGGKFSKIKVTNSVEL